MADDWAQLGELFAKDARLVIASVDCTVSTPVRTPPRGREGGTPRGRR